MTARLQVEVRDVEVLYRASLDIGGTLDRLLRPLHLSFARWSILNASVALGQSSIQELADYVGLHRTTVSALLRTLEQKGCVRIGYGGGDQRCAEISTTEQGRALFRAGRGIIEATNWTPLFGRLAAVLPSSMSVGSSPPTT